MILSTSSVPVSKDLSINIDIDQRTLSNLLHQYSIFTSHADNKKKMNGIVSEENVVFYGTALMVSYPAAPIDTIKMQLISLIQI